MNIESRKIDGTLITAVAGRLDALTAPEFDAWFGGQTRSGENQVVLDLSGLDYISSAGLRSLLAAAKGVKRAAGSIVLCGLAGPVAEVFRLSGFHSIFTVYATAEEALNAMG